ncbi:hypothetical protein [Paractinoplanes ferrugineus]|nr:hypothetical protein [Actinoplanes ferrugineus]
METAEEHGSTVPAGGELHLLDRTGRTVNRRTEPDSLRSAILLGP